MNKNKTVLLFSLCLAVIVSVCSSVFIYKNLDQFRDVINPGSNRNDSDQLIKDIFARNSISRARTTAGQEDNALSSSSLPYFIGEDNAGDNYFYYMSETKYGPAKDRCTLYKPYNEYEVMRQSYSFSDESGNYYSKELVSDADGSLITYRLNEPGTDTSYYGGNYAVKINYDMKNITEPALKVTEQYFDETVPADGVDVIPPDQDVQIEPAPIIKEEMSAEEYIKSIFPDQVSYDIVKDPNSEGYILTIESMIDCDPDYQIMMDQGVSSNSDLRVAPPASEDLQRVYTKFWIQADELKIYKTEVYFNGLNESDMISSVTDEIISEKRDFESVKSDFVYDLSVPVRTPGNIDYTTEYKARAQEYLVTNYSALLVPSQTTWDIYNVNAPEYFAIDTAPYLIDRDFYREDNIGQTMYQAEVDARAESDRASRESPKSLGVEISTGLLLDNSGQRPTSAVGDLSNYTIFAFKGSLTNDQILLNDRVTYRGLTNKSIEEVVTNIGAVQINVNGVLVNASAYESIEGGSGSSSSYDPGAAPDSDLIMPALPMEDNYKSYYVIFDYQGAKYAVDFWSTNDLNAALSQITLKSISTSDQSAINEVFNY